jgi:L-fuconolactonase
VQTRQSLDETHWLLKLAEETSWIGGVVGWVPLADPKVSSVLDELAFKPALKGVRHVLQAEDDSFFDRGDFNRGVALLRRYSLVYDLLIVERQLPAAMRFVDRHPHQLIILDHIGKPKIAAGELEPWRTRVQELARRPHVMCKLSGMTTEANFDAWSVGDLRPYVETVLEAFGAKRVMFASDWPVCAVAASYSGWLAAVHELIGKLSDSEQEQILGSNAAEAYCLPTDGYASVQAATKRSGEVTNS